jgi:MraZ protein
LFNGHYENSINDKGRLSIPSRFRNLLGEEGGGTLVVTKAMDKCLVAYTPEDWEKTVKKASSLSSVRKADIFYKRHIMGSAAECQIDAQGRILVPAHLREYAGLRKKCLCVGIGDRFEIWDSDAYETYMQEAMKDPSNLENELADRGL